MKCLSVHQPWAGLIVAGIRRMEIRSWMPPTKLIGGPLLIHASLAMNGEDRREFKKLFDIEIPDLNGLISVKGAVIGCANLSEVRKLSPYDWRKRCSEHLESGPRPYGDQTFGWIFSGSVIFEKPVAFRGKLGIFDVSDNILPKML